MARVARVARIIEMSPCWADRNRGDRSDAASEMTDTADGSRPGRGGARSSMSDKKVARRAIGGRCSQRRADVGGQRERGANIRCPTVQTHHSKEGSVEKCGNAIFLAGRMRTLFRHCERSEATQSGLSRSGLLRAVYPERLQGSRRTRNDDQRVANLKTEPRRHSHIPPAQRHEILGETGVTPRIDIEQIVGRGDQRHPAILTQRLP